MAKNLKTHPADTYKSIVHLFRFLKRLHIRLHFFVLATILSVAAVLFNILTIRLLFPLLKGMVNRDFGVVEKTPFLGTITEKFPQWFGTSQSLLILLALSLTAAVFFKNLMQYIATLCVSYQVKQVIYNLRKQIFDRYLSFGKLFYDRSNVGRLTGILVKIPQSIGSQLNMLQRLFSQILTLTAYLVIMLFISWKLTILTFLIFPAFIYFMQRITKNVKAQSKSHLASEERLESKIFNVLSSIPLVRAHNMAQEEKRRFEKVSDEESRLSFELDKKQKLILPIQDFGMMTAFLLVACAVVFLSPSQGTQELPGYLIFLYLVKLSLPGFGAINQFLFALARSSVRITKVSDILDSEHKHIIPTGNREFRGLEKNIKFHKTRFSYRGKNRVLQDINFKVQKGKTTAIVGPSGAGKTTLIHLLLRFYDCPPTAIKLDGMDIRDFSLASLSDHFAYVSQDPLFFDDTLRMNLTYGMSRNVHDDEIFHVAQKTHLDRFIQNLPDQLDTHIGDRGAQLSGGEKQRVAIARAILRNAEILILDEPTSSLDSETEALIRETLKEGTKDKTTIVIAHRLSTIKHADRIVVIEDGKNVEEGAFDELMEIEGKFYKYWKAQMFL